MIQECMCFHKTVTKSVDTYTCHWRKHTDVQTDTHKETMTMFNPLHPEPATIIEIEEILGFGQKTEVQMPQT